MVKKLLSAIMIVGLVGLFSTTLNAADVPAKKKKQTPQGLYLTPKEAHDMKTASPAKVLLVDVRTPEELYFVGYAIDVDKNIPLAYVDYSKLNKKGKKFASAKNKNLIAQLDAAVKAKGMTKDDAVIFICRSGDRSATAATMANKAGYTKAYTITTGTEGDKSAEKKRTVNGWKNDGLPWTYKFNKDFFQYEKPFQ